jgi:hypothetical protein
MKRIGVQRTLLNLQLQYQNLWKRETKKKSYLHVFNEFVSTTFDTCLEFGN